MEGVKNFLESVSIDGLSHISSSRKYASRLFWIVVVLFANIIAGFFIFESFAGWDENPIRTTVKTKPISQLKLPNITVCPPQNTFTDMNYDVMMVENKTLSKEKRSELFEYAVELIEEHVFMDNLNKLQEKKRFFNWYHGYSVMPTLQYMNHYDMTMRDYPLYWTYNMITAAASGEITSQYFGDKFKPELVERNVIYKVDFRVPESAKNKTNVAIHWSLEKVQMTELSSMDSYDDISLYGAYNSKDERFFNYTKTGPFEGFVRFDYEHSRYVHDTENLESMKLDVMPGFKLRWHYTGYEVFSETLSYISSRQNVEFVRIVNTKKLLCLFRPSILESTLCV